MLTPLPTWPDMDHAIPVVRPCPRRCGRLRFYLSEHYRVRYCAPCQGVGSRTWRVERPALYAAEKQRRARRYHERRAATGG